MAVPLVSIAAKRAGVSLFDMVKRIHNGYQPGVLQRRMLPYQRNFRKAAVPKIKAIPVPRRKRPYKFDSDILYFGSRSVFVVRKRGELRRSVKVKIGKGRPRSAAKRMYVRINNFPRNFLTGAAKFKGRYAGMSRAGIQRLLVPEVETYFDNFTKVLDTEK